MLVRAEQRGAVLAVVEGRATDVCSQCLGQLLGETGPADARVPAQQDGRDENGLARQLGKGELIPDQLEYWREMRKGLA